MRARARAHVCMRARGRACLSLDGGWKATHTHTHTHTPHTRERERERVRERERERTAGEGAGVGVGGRWRNDIHTFATKNEYQHHCCETSQRKATTVLRHVALLFGRQAQSDSYANVREGAVKEQL